MSRDANGNYTLPSGNPVVSGTTIESGWANPTMSDLAAEMTDSLSRSGKGGMSVAFQNVVGSEAAPGITWTLETDTGFYRAGATDMRATVQGVDKMRWNGTDVATWDGSTWNTVQTTKSADLRYAPLTHFAPNATSATLLDNGQLRAYTDAQSLNVRAEAGIDPRLRMYIDSLLTARIESVEPGSGGALWVVNEQSGGGLLLRVNDGGNIETGVEVVAGGKASLRYGDVERLATASGGSITTGQHTITDSVPTSTQHASRKDYVDNQDAANLLAAQTYADGGDTVTLTNANSYTDTEVGSEATARISGDAANNTYTDNAIAALGISEPSVTVLIIGNTMIQRGSQTTNSANDTAVAFATAFGGVPSVNVTPHMHPGFGGSHNHGVNSEAVGGFNYYSNIASNGTNLTGFSWIAVGPA